MSVALYELIFILIVTVVGKGKVVEEALEEKRIPVPEVIDIEVVELKEWAEAVERDFEALQGDWQGKQSSFLMHILT